MDKEGVCTAVFGTETGIMKNKIEAEWNHDISSALAITVNLFCLKLTEDN